MGEKAALRSSPFKEKNRISNGELIAKSVEDNGESLYLQQI
jgi:hypothetical protein